MRHQAIIVNATTQLFFFVSLLIPFSSWAVGAPSYLPDGPHPRIAVSEAVITKLQTINASGSNTWWERMRAEADADITRAGDWNNSEKIPHTFALLWLVTGNTKYRDAGIASLQAGLAYYDAIPVGNTSGYRASVSDMYRWNSQNLFSAYDWLYNDLSTIQKQTFANIICNFATYQKNNGYKSDDPGNNYFGAQFRGAILAGIATYGLTVSNPNGDPNGTTEQPLTLLNWARTTKFDYIKEAMVGNVGESIYSGMATGGIYPEGPEYSPQTLSYIYYGINALKDATKQDLFIDISEWVKDNILFTIHQSAPDNGHSYPRNDYLNNAILPDPIGPNRAKAIMMEIATKERQGNLDANYIQYWLKTIGLDWNTSNWWAPSKEDPYHFIFYDSSYTATTYLDGSIGNTFFRNNNLGQILSRHSWSNDSIWWGYIMGWRGTDHMHAESGHFTIKRKGEWVVGHEVGWAGDWLYTDAHNCMMLQNSPPTNRWTNQPLTPYGWKEGSQYYIPNAGSYGDDQTGADSRDLPDLSFEDTAYYTYVSGEDTSHYNHPTYLSTYLDHHFRSFVDLKDGIFVVLDKVKNNQPNLFKRFIIHLLKPTIPTINGNYIENSTTYSDVRITAVLPVDSTISYIDETTESSAYQNFFRVTSAGNTESLTETFLHVIDVREKGSVARPLLSVTSTKMVGTIIHSNTDKVILFGSSYDGLPVTGDITYTTPSLINAEHILFSLEPGALYSLSSRSVDSMTTFTLTNNTAGTLQVSENGVLHIPSSYTPSAEEKKPVIQKMGYKIN